MKTIFQFLTGVILLVFGWAFVFAVLKDIHGIQLHRLFVVFIISLIGFIGTILKDEK